MKLTMHLTSPTIRPGTVFLTMESERYEVAMDLREIIEIERLFLPNHLAASYRTENRYISRRVISHKTDETFCPIIDRACGFRQRCCLATFYTLMTSY